MRFLGIARNSGVARGCNFAEPSDGTKYYCLTLAGLRKSSKYQVPYRQGAMSMALSVQMYKLHNYLTNEDIIIPRLVNQQTLDFNALCEYLADGSTVTAGDVAAVMKLIELRLPLILGLNAKVVCSPEGLTFRPAVSGSLTQKQLKAKLEAKLAADPTLDIDVNREITTSDLAISDLTATISIELPKKWNERFQTKAEFKRVNKTAADDSENNPSSDSPEGEGNGGDNAGGSNGGGGTGTITPSGSDNTGGGGNDGGGGDNGDGADDH